MAYTVSRKTVIIRNAEGMKIAMTAETLPEAIDGRQYLQAGYSV